MSNLGIVTELPTDKLFTISPRANFVLCRRHQRKNKDAAFDWRKRR